MFDPTQGVKDVLVTAGVGTDAQSNPDPDWSIHIARRPDKPDAVITVYESGGVSPEPSLLLDYPSFQVMVRGDQSGYTAARNKCTAIVDALLGLPSQVVNGDQWDGVLAVGGVNPLGFDENDRPLFSLNFRMFVEPASGTYRTSL